MALRAWYFCRDIVYEGVKDPGGGQKHDRSLGVIKVQSANDGLNEVKDHDDEGGHGVESDHGPTQETFTMSRNYSI